MKINHLALFLVSILLISTVETCYSKSLQIDSPLKAAIFYFPSPVVMRCLHHSGLPKARRKAFIYREATFPKGDIVKQTVTVGLDVKNNGFVFRGSIREGNRLKLMKTDGGPFFKQGKKGKLPFSFFGLEDLIGVPAKVKIKGLVGNQHLNYETFLKSTKGKIENQNYTLELTGEDKSVDGKVKYFLSGTGSLGNDTIAVNGAGIGDYYEITENYGTIMVYTTVKVYD